MRNARCSSLPIHGNRPSSTLTAPSFPLFPPACLPFSCSLPAWCFGSCRAACRVFSLKTSRARCPQTYSCSWCPLSAVPTCSVQPEEIKLLECHPRGHPGTPDIHWEELHVCRGELNPPNSVSHRGMGCCSAGEITGISSFRSLNHPETPPNSGNQSKTPKTFPPSAETCKEKEERPF